MKKLVLFLLCTFVIGFTAGMAHADPLVDAGAIVLDAGSAAASSPSDALHDPLEQPRAAFDDAKALKKTGWPLLLLGLLVMATRSLAKARERYSWLAFLGKGKAAIAVAAVLAIAGAAFDTLALGGSWAAVLIAAGGAAFALLMPTAPPPKPVTA